MPDKYKENKHGLSTIGVLDVNMGIFRKLKKLRSFHIVPDKKPQNNGHHMRDETVPPNVNYGPLPRSFFSAVNLAREVAGYDPLPVFPREPIPTGDENFMYQNSRDEFSALDRSRSKSRDRSFDRSRGTPVKYRRRPISPELFQPHASSPFLFRPHSLPGSPDMHRRFQQAQQFQHIPRQPQFDMMMPPPPGHFFPQFQQPFYPMINTQPLFMMQQPQIYPFF